jgi:hypothetical protein
MNCCKEKKIKHKNSSKKYFILNLIFISLVLFSVTLIFNL